MRSLSIVVFLVICSTQAIAIDLADISGYGMDTQAGLDGRVIKVTNLNAKGKGSLAWAIAQKGPRLIVFEVGGVINLNKNRIDITEPFATIAGETAPSPGITLIRGGIAVLTHDVRITHLMVRPGDNLEPKRSTWESDAISAMGAQAYRVHVDHCSLTWAIDENAAASGPRNKGHEATSKQITFSNNIIAEALDYATHVKGKHSKGLIVHDYVREVAVIGNLFAHNDRRNPYFKGHSDGVVVNNLMYNLGNAAVQVGYVADEYKESGLQPAKPKVSVVGNVLLYGQDTYSDLPLVAYQGKVFMQDNMIKNLEGKSMPLIHGDVELLDKHPAWPQGLTPLSSQTTETDLLSRVGARFWDRDPIDQRIINSVLKGTGRIIDSQEEVGGYPVYKPVKRKLTVPDKNRNQWLQEFQKQNSF